MRLFRVLSYTLLMTLSLPIQKSFSSTLDDLSPATALIRNHHFVSSRYIETLEKLNRDISHEISYGNHLSQAKRYRLAANEIEEFVEDGTGGHTFVGQLAFGKAKEFRLQAASIYKFFHPNKISHELALDIATFFETQMGDIKTAHPYYLAAKGEVVARL